MSKPIEEGLNISITFESKMDMAQRLKDQSKVEDRSKSAIIRRALEAYFIANPITVEAK